MRTFLRSNNLTAINTRSFAHKYRLFFVAGV